MPKKLWIRTGMDIDFTEDEYQHLLNLHEQKEEYHDFLENHIKHALQTGTFTVNGETYIPETILGEFLNDPSWNDTPEFEFHFDVKH